ncbi:MAG: NAD-dependent protein deacylase [Christensenellales bacterium]|jgi:NAD-dependent deacetylase|nr:NAD-dependent protein deacylase [Clostridiales bacterium]
MDKINKLIEIINGSQKIVFFSGAGVSTGSGIPDFRGGGGLFAQKSAVPLEIILSHNYFINNTEDFYDYYKNHMLYPNAQPNIVHKKVASWEKNNKLLAVITQNIDNLHQKAGSRQVVELHGNAYRNYCMNCGRKYDIEYILQSKGAPKCHSCGGLIKPDVVLYGEALDTQAINAAQESIACADTLIVAGTSLSVQPAASLIYCFKGKNFVILNKNATFADRIADLVINEDLTEIFNQL